METVKYFGNGLSKFFKIWDVVELITCEYIKKFFDTKQILFIFLNHKKRLFNYIWITQFFGIY